MFLQDTEPHLHIALDIPIFLAILLLLISYSLDLIINVKTYVTIVRGKEVLSYITSSQGACTAPSVLTIV